MIFLELFPVDFSSRVKVSVRLLASVFIWIGLDVLSVIGSLGFRLLSGRRSYGAVIKDDAYSRAMTIGGYVFFMLTLIFAIDFGSVIFAVATMGVLLMQLVGERLSSYAGPPVQRLSKPKLGSSLTYVVLDLGLFAALDIVGANTGSLPGLPLSTIGIASFGQLLTIGSLFTVQVSIAEERFFRGGAANLGAKYGGPILGILTSATFFFAFHVPAYYSDPLKLAIIGTDGAVLAWGDFDTGRLFPSMLAHLINNVFSILFLTVFGPIALRGFF